jgi:hypothetical protein
LSSLPSSAMRFSLLTAITPFRRFCFYLVSPSYLGW